MLHTDFLTPPIVKESVSVLGKLADVTIVAQGGYPEVGFHLFREKFRLKNVNFELIGIVGLFVFRLSGVGSRLDILMS